MTTLLLLRHAKSSWADPDLVDFDRPLSERGISDCPRMGAWLAANVPPPDLVLVSASRRTLDTWALLAPPWAANPRVEVREKLYHAPPKVLLETVRATDPAVGCLLIVGHNQGLDTLAQRLAGRGDRALRRALAAKFPTAACAVLRFEGTWADVAPASGTLTAFPTPKTI